MTPKLALLTTVLAFGLGMPAALAQDASSASEEQSAPQESAPANPDDGGAALQDESPKSDEDSSY